MLVHRMPSYFHDEYLLARWPDLSERYGKRGSFDQR